MIAVLRLETYRSAVHCFYIRNFCAGLFQLFCILILSASILGQGDRSAVMGIITDSTKAVLPGVEVVVVNHATGVRTKTFTTEAGVYRFSHLPRGTYRISASASGFKTAVRDPFELGVAGSITFDFELEIGELETEVVVLGPAPVLGSTASELGFQATQKEFHTWPVLIEDGQRQLQSFIFSSMPGTEGNSFAGSINGGQLFSHEILIEGLTLGRFNLTGGSLNQFSPSVDATSEFKLQGGTLSAQYGATQTSVANFAMKSGSNRYHGSLYWLHLNNALRAHSWTENLYDLDKSRWLENSVGGTFGGPLILPGYTGQDRTHFFLSYERGDLDNLRPTGSVSLPIQNFKEGDFSALFDPAFTGDARSGMVLGHDALGREVRFGQIYDPGTARQLEDGTWLLDPFPENIIPIESFSSVSRNILEFADTPDPLFPGLRRNYPRVSGTPFKKQTSFTIKVDHQISENHKLSGFFLFTQRKLATAGVLARYLPYPGSASSAWFNSHNDGRLLRISEDWTIDSTALNHIAFGYNRFVDDTESAHVNEAWPERIGLEGVGQATFPWIWFSGPSPTLTGSYSYLGNLHGDHWPGQNFVLSDNLSLIRGKHTLRLGFEIRRYHSDLYSAFDGGSFNFNSRATSLPSFSSETGFSYASFLLGRVHSAELDIPAFAPRLRVWYSALYFHDDWRIRPNLTLNWGLRWDIPGPLKEATNRMSAMETTLANPGADGYPGALVFLGNGRDSFQDANYKELAPRVGFAWNPKSGLVVRCGYGINYSAPLENGWGFPFDAGFNGFNPVTRDGARFPQAPALNWDEGYPAYDLSQLPNLDPAQRNGGPVYLLEPSTLKLPYVQNWNLGIQYEPGWGIVTETNYIGNKGSRLEDAMFAESINQLDPKYLSLGDTLYEDIERHPEIKKPYSSFEGQVHQALRPYPQYQLVSTTHLLGATSNYHALQITATKRAATGLSFLAAYTFSKTLASSDSVGMGLYSYQGQDFYNRKNEKSLVTFHYPQHFRLSWIYDLPFGEGRRWLNSGPLGKILGDWTISAIHSYSSGAPLSITAGRFHWNSYLGNPPGGWRGDVLLPGEEQRVGRFGAIDSVTGTPYLNPEAFGEPPSSPWGVGLRLGTAPRHLPDVRGPSHQSEDLSVIKRTTFGLTESSSIDFRIDIRNLLNRAGIADPVTDVSSPEFGRIFSNRYEPRQIQIGLRFNF